MFLNSYRHSFIFWDNIKPELLITLIAVVWAMDLSAQKAILKEKEVNTVSMPGNPLLQDMDAFRIHIRSEDPWVLQYLREYNRLESLKIPGKTYTSSGPADFQIRFDVGSWETLDDRIIKVGANRYDRLATYQMPILLSLKNDQHGALMMDTTLFEEGTDNFVRSVSADRMVSLSQSYDSLSLRKAKQRTLDQALEEAKNVLLQYVPVSATIPLRLGTITSKKQDFSAYDEATEQAFDALSELILIQDRSAASQRLRTPMSYWEGQLEEPRPTPAEVLVNQFNLATCHMWLGNHAESMAYLQAMQPGSGKGAGYFYSVYRIALQQELLEREPSLKAS